MYNTKDIEVIVKFKTPDGKLFDDLSDALSHKLAPLYRMWRDDPEFSETDSVDKAFYVYLPDASAVDSFIYDSSQTGNITKGIYQAGWYYWDSDNFRYCALPNSLGRRILGL